MLHAITGQPGDLPCQQPGADLWFSEYPAQIELAKSLCAECPVRATCLSGALAREESAGVWGGQLVVNGIVVPFKRGRGRPRKNAAAA